MKSVDVIVDLDGTLCDVAWRVGFVRSKPKNWNAFYAGIPNDPVNEYLLNILVAMKTVNPNYRFIIVTARPEDNRKVTEEWLQRNVLPHLQYEPKIFMRQENDHRPDDVVKLEILANVRSHGYDPVLAFDDRQRVVDAWNSVGINVFQWVGPMGRFDG